ncbi:hypothetical protein ACFOZ7_06525 [Natribaculum luteum]|uniref:Uncharacterized protein n=1 Tax=Natribaculum luteum TaxID=1586232 RepID=A0ABD5NX26_9EURY|nr:hypothetical protein [Natribaculum luteum]
MRHSIGAVLEQRLREFLDVVTDSDRQRRYWRALTAEQNTSTGNVVGSC